MMQLPSIMSYSIIAELPDKVKACLDKKDAQVWMQIYNDSLASAPEGLNDEERVYYAQTAAWMGTRDLPSAFSVVEWATVEEVDRDNEKVTMDKVEEHVDKYIEYGGAMQDTHSNLPLGHVWHAERAVHPDTGKDGLMVYYNLRGGTLETDKGRADWLKGKKYLSIGASASVDGTECDSTQCWTNRGVRDLYEISLCDTPANPYAEPIEVFEGRINKGKMKKVTEPLILKTLERQLFCGNKGCTLMKAVRVLGGITIPHKAVIGTTHITVHASEEYQVPMMKAMDAGGLMFDYDPNDDTYAIRHKKDTYDAYHSRCRKNGYIDGDGTLTDKMTKEMFCKLYDYGFIVKSKGVWMMKETGAMTSASAGASNAVYGKIPYREIQSFMNQNSKKIKASGGEK